MGIFLFALANTNEVSSCLVLGFSLEAFIAYVTPLF